MWFDYSGDPKDTCCFTFLILRSTFGIILGVCAVSLLFNVIILLEGGFVLVFTGFLRVWTVLLLGILLMLTVNVIINVNVMNPARRWFYPGVHRLSGSVGGCQAEQGLHCRGADHHDHFSHCDHYDHYCYHDDHYDDHHNHHNNFPF